jgi:hypothetical protein
MRQWIMAAAVLAMASGAAMAQWSDNFDSYVAGQSLHGVNGWKGWDNDPTWTAFVTDDPFGDPPNSVEIAGDSDLVHEYSGATSGQWTYTAYMYVPNDFDGITYFILLNVYNDLEPYSWSIQTAFDSSTGLVTDDFVSGPSLPILYDQWAEIRVEIDLDADTRELYYADQLLSTLTWTRDQTDAVLEIAAVDLFANAATPVYFDAMSLVGSGTVCPGDLDGDGDTDQSDLGILLAAYDLNGDGDLDGDGDTDQSDLGVLLADYGCGT